jgi:hypothetical protein
MNERGYLNGSKNPRYFVGGSIRTGQYQAVVALTASFPRQWGWEICRDGKPLPVRLREAGFKSERTATAAARVALREFLIGLRREEVADGDG